MVVQQGAGVPQLVVLKPEEIQGRRIELSGDYLVVGREPDCDVRFDDLHVSRKHAALQRRGNAVYVNDLGSSGGTFVNESPAAMTELRGGDVVRFATVQARFDAARPSAETTRVIPAQTTPPQPGRMPAGPVQAEAAHFSIDEQNGGVINNLAGNQYNQTVLQRDSFLRDIAATRTKARWLIWTGFLFFVGGFAVFAFTDLSFIKQVSNSLQSGSPPSSITSPFGRNVGGVPVGLLGWAAAVIGMLLLIVGIVLHIVATSRRKRVEREYPLPTPGPYSGSPGRAR
jgi:pSer/pThr/pTyr-binding forkhead associated (FHA) protein